MNFFHGCTALITGASSGIGEEFARQLAPHARAIILVARRMDRLEALQRELDRPGLTVHCHAADLADEVQIEALRAELRGTGVSVTALCPGPVNTEFSLTADRPTGRDRMPAPEIFKVPVEEVVSTGLAAVERDRARAIPGWLVCVVMTITSLVPIFLLRLFLTQRRRGES